MVQLYNAIGERTNWNLDDIVLYTGKVLAPGVSAGVGVIVSPGSRRCITLGHSGFRSEYVDKQDPKKPPADQSHHFVGYFALGVRWTVDRWTELFTRCRELGSLNCLSLSGGPGKEPGDYKLGVVAANMGHVMKRYPDSVRNIADSIRITICDPPSGAPQAPGGFGPAK